MDKEEFYNRMDDLVAELTEQYNNELQHYAEKIISQIDTVEQDLQEINTYIDSRTVSFEKDMISKVHKTKAQLDTDGTTAYTKPGLAAARSNIATRFKRIYVDAVEKMKSLVN